MGPRTQRALNSSRSAGRGGGCGQGGHRSDLGGGEAADDDGVEGAFVGAQLLLGVGAVGGGDADGALGLGKAIEVVAVALVEVAVEGLLLGEAVGAVGADSGADVAEDGRRGTVGCGGAGSDLLAGAGGEAGGHPVE